MKNGIIALVCLIPLLLLMAYGIYRKNNCISKQEAEITFNSAQDEEGFGKVSEAYNLYKKIDAYACENYELREKAFNKAASLKKKLGYSIEGF
ncbi:hypothetical protein [Haliea atlantica]